MNAKRTFWYFSMVISGVSNQERGGRGRRVAGNTSQLQQLGWENGKKEK